MLAPTADPDAALDSRNTLTVNGTSGYADEDFGYAPLGQTPTTGMIGDTVFLDRNANNTADTGEGMQGVLVQLYDSTGTTVLATAFTDANGRYYFGGLAAGTYLTRVGTATLPAGLSNTFDPDGGVSDEALASLAAGAKDLAQDFGYQRTTNPNTISGALWNDRNADGTRQAGETNGYAGVTIALRGANGHILATTTTDAGGNFSFNGLPDGTYTVEITDRSIPRR